MTQISLNVHSYREVHLKLEAEHALLTKYWEEKKSLHVKDVQAVQNEMQKTDIRLEIDSGRIGERKSLYLRDAAVGAKKHAAALQSMYGVGNQDFAFISVYQLHTLGTVKALVLQHIPIIF